MDHRTLLKKYIAHVTDIQGVDFLTMGRTKSSVQFSDDEREALYAISEDAEMETVLGHQPASDHPTLENTASSNLTALFLLIGAYLEENGPVHLEFNGRATMVTTEQDAFMRHLAERALVVSDAVLTDAALRELPHHGRNATIDDNTAQREAAECRAALSRLAKGEQP